MRNSSKQVNYSCTLFFGPDVTTVGAQLKSVYVVSGMPASAERRSMQREFLSGFLIEVRVMLIGEKSLGERVVNDVVCSASSDAQT